MDNHQTQIGDTISACRRMALQINPWVQKKYFPAGEYKIAAEKFFQDIRDNVEHFKKTTYPFSGNYLLNKKNFSKVVITLPEFIASIIFVGIETIYSLEDFRISPSRKKVKLRLEKVLFSSEILIETWDLMKDLESPDSDEYHASERIRNTLHKFAVAKPEYDILGCFQVIHCSLAIFLGLYPQIDSRKIKFILHEADGRRQILYELIGPLAVPLSILSITNVSSFNYEQARSLIHSALITARQSHESDAPAPSSITTLGKDRITLVPKLKSGNTSQNEIIIAGSKPKIAKDAAFDFLYLIAWLDLNKKPQLEEDTDLKDEISDSILKDCTKIIQESRFHTKWKSQYETKARWDALSEINILLGIELLKSGSKVFSINDDYEIKLLPYPLK